MLNDILDHGRETLPAKRGRGAEIQLAGFEDSMQRIYPKRMVKRPSVAEDPIMKEPAPLVELKRIPLDDSGYRYAAVLSKTDESALVEESVLPQEIHFLGPFVQVVPELMKA
jgi:hypothetical protein